MNELNLHYFLLLCVLMSTILISSVFVNIDYNTGFVSLRITSLSLPYMIISPILVIIMFMYVKYIDRQIFLYHYDRVVLP